MQTKIQRWGNSQGLRLARQVLQDVHLNVGDDVEVNVKDGLIVISPVRRVRGRLRLETLVSRIPEGSQVGEEEWGAPVGREEW
ncbi:MAG: transcriptional regulator/antitoxin, MazE [Acidobacteria bacterium]|nr:transcriptional regulator/antitoxin, MazE [Acidobacteriota bacterium]